MHQVISFMQNHFHLDDFIVEFLEINKINNFYVIQSLKNESIINSFNSIVDINRDSYQNLLNEYPDLPGNYYEFCFAHQIL